MASGIRADVFEPELAGGFAGDEDGKGAVVILLPGGSGG